MTHIANKNKKKIGIILVYPHTKNNFFFNYKYLLGCIYNSEIHFFSASTLTPYNPGKKFPDYRDFPVPVAFRMGFWRSIDVLFYISSIRKITTVLKIHNSSSRIS